MADPMMADPLLDVIANCAAGFTVAYSELCTRTPRFRMDRSRVSGTATIAPPAYDPEIVTVYTDAQAAVVHAYHRTVALGAPPFWVSSRNQRDSGPIDPLVLTSVLAGIRRYIAHLDDGARDDLLAAERKLRPFWRTPPRPKVCTTCNADFAPFGRRMCWSCTGRSKRKRTRKGK